MRRVLLLTILATTLLAPPAAAQWGETPPVSLGAAEVATCLRDAGGGRVAAVATQGRRYGAALFAVAPGGLRPDGEVAFGRLVEHCPVAAADASGAAVAAAVARTARTPSRLVVSARAPGGAFSPPAELARLRTLEATIDPVVAVGADGSMAVAWLERFDELGGRAAHQALRIARRAPGEPFGPAETLVRRMGGDDAQTDAALAIDAAGTATVAWVRTARDGGMQAVDVASAARGERFGAPQRLGDDLIDVRGIALAVAPDGRALVAHDGNERIQVLERAPGGAAFAAGPALGRGGGQPAVALAADGGAVVAWRGRFDDTVLAAVRPAGGAFGVARTLDPDSGTGTLSGSVLWPIGAAPWEGVDTGVRVAAEAGGRATVAWIRAGAGWQDAASARVAVGVNGLGRAVRVGNLVRDVDAVVPAPGGAVWADNRTTGFFSGTPAGDGRLHLSRADRPSVAEPAPAVALRSRPQALYWRQPLVVDAVCAAACDLRAHTAPRARRGGERPGAALATGGRAGAGRVRLRLEPISDDNLAPARPGRVRVVVEATAPSGTDIARSELRVRARRRPPPPLQAPLGLRARRAGDDVVLTWRTAGPARRVTYSAYGRRTRGTRHPPGFAGAADRVGRGERRFRLRLRGAQRARWVVLRADPMDPPYERAVVRVVRVR